MNEQVTEIIFLLDRSGSMAGLEEDTIGGFNALIEKQIQHEGETIVTVVLFDDRYEILWNGINAHDARLTNKEYNVRGATALLDAVGKTIVNVGNRLKQTVEDRRPGKVLFVITTDGMENASREYTYEKVQELTKHQQDKYNWEFIFIGANIDAAKEASNYGINMDDAHIFESSSTGIESMYHMLDVEISLKRRK